jgi:hypothetical protein
MDASSLIGSDTAPDHDRTGEPLVDIASPSAHDHTNKEDTLLWNSSEEGPLRSPNPVHDEHAGRID